MASPSSPYLHHTAQYGGAAYAHPAVGGKGIPVHVPAPAYDSSSPAPSSPSVASSSARWAHQPGLASGPPDLTERYRLKAKYLKLQKRYFRSIEIRKDLTLELAEKEEKVQQLQDEVNLILDQIHDSDYAHLRPKHDSLFSDDEDTFELEDDEDEGLLRVKAEDGDEEIDGDDKGKKRIRMRDLEDEEDERRKELEARYGIDGTKRVVTVPPLKPTPPPAPIPAAALPTLPHIQTPPALSASATPSSSASAHDQPPQPQTQQAAAPKRLKLTFGGGGGVGSNASFA